MRIAEYSTSAGGGSVGDPLPNSGDRTPRSANRWRMTACASAPSRSLRKPESGAMSRGCPGRCSGSLAERRDGGGRRRSRPHQDRRAPWASRSRNRSLEGGAFPSRISTVISGRTRSPQTRRRVPLTAATEVRQGSPIPPAKGAHSWHRETVSSRVAPDGTANLGRDVGPRLPDRWLRCSRGLASSLLPIGRTFGLRPLTSRCGTTILSMRA